MGIKGFGADTRRAGNGLMPVKGFSRSTLQNVWVSDKPLIY